LGCKFTSERRIRSASFSSKGAIFGDFEADEFLKKCKKGVKKVKKTHFLQSQLYFQNFLMLTM
jgi:hypothetical protein